MRAKHAGSLLAVALLSTVGLATPAAAAAPVVLSVPSLDASPGGAPVSLPATWFAAEPPAGAKPAPALLLLHGCGGLFERPRAERQLGPRYTELAAALNALGIHVLVTDSLTPRGERELCTQRTGERKVTQLQRRRDALGALAWLARQPGVDAARLGLLGWSNGGSTVLAATNLVHPEVRRAAVRPSLAVAFYPGCEAELRRGYRPSAPLLMLLGEADDWTPAAPCKVLAARAAASVPAPQWEAYEGAHHGFDGTAPLRLRRDVPNGANPGQGVHVGAHPEARAAARARLERFLRETWGLPARPTT
ncbi:MAG: dienelactone hydrolase family protein [Burkholderiales bacterium]|nr:dienelactone hydrolase family protein [Burkholderiales bacterium]